METLKIEQCDRDAAADIWRDYVGRVGECIAENAIRSGASDDTMIVKAFARHRIAERERDAGIAKTGWVSADYNIVGITDADMAMRLCEHIETAIREQSNGA